MYGDVILMYGNERLERHHHYRSRVQVLHKVGYRAHNIIKQGVFVRMGPKNI
jgi:hypothetical protein